MTSIQLNRRIAIQDNMPSTSRPNTAERIRLKREKQEEEKKEKREKQEEEQKEKREKDGKEIEEKLFLHRQNMDGFTGQVRGSEELSRYAVPSLLHSYVMRNNLDGMWIL
jgi:hypothetical protein